MKRLNAHDVYISSPLTHSGEVPPGRSVPPIAQFERTPPRARDCFRFLYHIIKLRQVLNNFSPSRPARRRRRFEGGDCLALRLQGENEKGESQERRARTGYNLTKPSRPFTLKHIPHLSGLGFDGGGGQFLFLSILHGVMEPL